MNESRVRKRIEGAVRRFMADHSLWPEAGRLLVAVSGGQDSTALLLSLTRLAKRRRVELVAAHFDHGLRGGETGRLEREAVERLAAKAGVSMVTGAGDVRARAARERLTIEEASRAERYEFLARAAREADCEAVATGHTASDQAETVLMHIMRGTGLAGLGGMAPRSPWPLGGHEGLLLVRPLLAASREDTVTYCAACGAEPVEDESNASTLFLRNRVRHELMPALRAYNPRIEATLVRLANSARTDAEYLEAVAKTALQEHDAVARVSRDLLSSWPPSLRRNGLRLALKAVAGDGQGFAEAHVVAMERLVHEGQTGDGLDLPRGIRVELTRDVLEVRRLGHPAAAELPIEPVSLKVPGQASLGPLVVCATKVPAEGLSVPRAGTRAIEGCPISVEVDAVALGARLWVRGWRPGDRFQPLGMQGTKKLQDFFVDAHVRRSERDLAPIFGNEQGIVWVGGLRIADWAKPVSGRPTVTLSYEPIED